MKVKDLMRKNPKTVLPDAPISAVWNLVGSLKFHILPVVNKEGHIKGIITAEDVLMSLMPNYREFFSDFYPNAPTIEDIEKKLENQVLLHASDVMNKKVYTVKEDADVFKALSRLLLYNVRILPVLNDDEKLTGFIVEKDIFKYLFDKEKKVLKKLKK